MVTDIASVSVYFCSPVWQVDVENFWNYFYTAILVLMMIHYFRTRREQDWENQDYIDVRSSYNI